MVSAEFIAQLEGKKTAKVYSTAIFNGGLGALFLNFRIFQNDEMREVVWAIVLKIYVFFENEKSSIIYSTWCSRKPISVL